MPAAQQKPASAQIYAFPEKALLKWSERYVRLQRMGECAVQAIFTFEGSTCSMGGQPFRMDYSVQLESMNPGSRIMGMGCTPHETDSGYKNTCHYLADPSGFLETIEGERPFLGHSLEAVLAWNPAVNPAGCLCLRGNRDHKWRMVLQTIHFKLSRSVGPEDGERIID